MLDGKESIVNDKYTKEMFRKGKEYYEIRQEQMADFKQFWS